MSNEVTLVLPDHLDAMGAYSAMQRYFEDVATMAKRSGETGEPTRQIAQNFADHFREITGKD